MDILRVFGVDSSDRFLALNPKPLHSETLRRPPFTTEAETERTSRPLNTRQRLSARKRAFFQRQPGKSRLSEQTDILELANRHSLKLPLDHCLSFLSQHNQNFSVLIGSYRKVRRVNLGRCDLKKISRFKPLFRNLCPICPYAHENVRKRRFDRDIFFARPLNFKAAAHSVVRPLATAPQPVVDVCGVTHFAKYPSHSYKSSRPTPFRSA